MVANMVRAAASRVADFVSQKPRVDHRELLMIVKYKEKWWVIQSPQPLVQKHEKVKQFALSTLRPALPWVNSMNIIDHRGTRRFVDSHIEYDVVRIAFCDMLGLEKGHTPRAALEDCGFTFIPLARHSLATDIFRLFPEAKPQQ